MTEFKLNMKKTKLNKRNGPTTQSGKPILSEKAPISLSKSRKLPIKLPPSNSSQKNVKAKGLLTHKILPKSIVKVRSKGKDVSNTKVATINLSALRILNMQDRGAGQVRIFSNDHYPSVSRETHSTEFHMRDISSKEFILACIQLQFYFAVFYVCLGFLGKCLLWWTHQYWFVRNSNTFHPQVCSSRPKKATNRTRIVVRCCRAKTCLNHFACKALKC